MQKLKSGLLRFNGTLSYWVSEDKYVEVEGETYTKTTRSEVITTLSKMRKEKDRYFHNYEYEFDMLDTTLEIEEYSGFSYSSLSKMARRSYGSENKYVMALECAEENDLLPNKIVSISTGKTERRYNQDTLREIMRTLKVWVRLYDYGFNNSVYYSVSLEDFFEVPYDRIPENLSELFLKNGVNLKAKNKVNEIVKLINKKQQYETSKQ